MARNSKAFNLSPYNDHGRRTLDVVVYALELGEYGVSLPDLSEALGDYTRGYNGGEILGTPEEWNRATGFIYAYWESGSNVAPFDDSYDFAQLVTEHMNAHSDESWDYRIYDADGQQRFLDVKIVATMSEHREGLTYEEYQEKAKAKQRAKAKRKKIAAARKAAKEAEKAKVLAKLTPKERKALGL